MTRHFLLVLLALMLVSAAAYASDPEPADLNLDLELAITDEVAEPLMSLQETGDSFLASVERASHGSQCQHETCDYSVECFEGCEAQYPVSQEDPDSFCWCVRACSEICI